METARKVTPPSWTDRIFIGIPVLFVGLLMNVGLFLGMPNPTRSLDDLFLFLFLSAYEVVANLFVLVGLKKLLGEYQVLDRIIGHNLKRLLWIAVGISLVTILAALLATVARQGLTLF